MQAGTENAAKESERNLKASSPARRVRRMQLFGLRSPSDQRCEVVLPVLRSSWRAAGGPSQVSW